MPDIPPSGLTVSYIHIPPHIPAPDKPQRKQTDNRNITCRIKKAPPRITKAGQVGRRFAAGSLRILTEATPPKL